MPDQYVLKNKASEQLFNKILYMYKLKVLSCGSKPQTIDVPGQTISIDLSSYKEWDDEEVYGLFVKIFINSKIQVILRGHNDYGQFEPCERFLGSRFNLIDDATKNFTPLLIDEKSYQQIIDKLNLVFQPLYQQALSLEKQAKDAKLKEEKRLQELGKNAAFEFINIKTAHNSSI